MTTIEKPAAQKRGRGFASMSKERLREIASMGGKAAHAQGTAHTWTSEEAQAAGRKGGARSRRGKARQKIDVDFDTEKW